MATIAVDFDGTLMKPGSQKPGMRLGLPHEGAVEAMQKMKAAGHSLVIFTVRGDRPKHIMDWCQYYHIPYYDVTNIKRNFDLMIDDRCATFRGDWSEFKTLWTPPQTTLNVEG